MANQMTWGPQSRLPMQAAPVDRTLASAALSGGSGVEASGILDWIGLGGAKPIIEKVGGGLWDLLA